MATNNVINNQCGNIRFTDNTISSTNTDGNIELIPDGNGEVLLKANPVSDLGAATKEYADDLVQGGATNYAQSTGSANAYVVTLSPAPAALVTGLTIRVKANFTNTASATLDLNGLGAATIVKRGDVTLANGDWPIGFIGTFVFDGTNWQMQNPNYSRINMSGNVISSTGTDDNIVLDPDGTGSVFLDSTIWNNAGIYQQTTDADFTIAANGTGGVILTPRATVDNISIDGNTISATSGALTLTPFAGSVLNLDNSNFTVDDGVAVITGSLSVDNLNINGNVISSTSGEVVLTPLAGQFVRVTDKLLVGTLSIDDNTIASTNANGNISFQPNGAGEVIITKATSVNNIRIVTNTISSTDANGNINLSPNGTGTVVINTDLDVDNVNIDGNTITVTNTNADLNLSGNGTGAVALGATEVSTSLTVGTDLYVNTDLIYTDSDAGKIGLNTSSLASETITINGTMKQLSGNSYSAAGVAYEGTTGTGTKNFISFTWSNPNMYGQIDGGAAEMVVGTVSDARVKRNIQNINDSLSLVRGLRAVTYNSKAYSHAMKDKDDKDVVVPISEDRVEPIYGLIADEVAQVIPNAVHQPEGGLKSLKNDQLQYLALDAMQKIDQRSNVLRTEVSSAFYEAKVTDYIIGVTRGGAVEIRLPDISTLTGTKKYIIKDESGSATITITAVQNIERGGQQVVILGGESVELYNSNIQWFII